MKAKWFYRLIKSAPIWTILLAFSLSKMSNVPSANQQLRPNTYAKLTDFYDNNNIKHNAFSTGEHGSDFNGGYYTPKTVHVDLKQHILRSKGSTTNISKPAIAHICQDTYTYNQDGIKLDPLDYGTKVKISTPIKHLNVDEYKKQQIDDLQYKLFCYDPNYNDPKLYYSSYIPLTKIGNTYYYAIGSDKFVRAEDVDLINNRPIVAQNIPCYIESFEQYGVIANAVVAQPNMSKRPSLDLLDILKHSDTNSAIKKFDISQYDQNKLADPYFENKSINGKYYDKPAFSDLDDKYKSPSQIEHANYPFSNYRKLTNGEIGVYATATHINMEKTSNPYYDDNNIFHYRYTPQTITCADAANLMPAIYLKNSFDRSTINKLNNQNSKYRYTQYALGAMAMYNLQPASKYFFNFNNGQIVNNYKFGSWRKPLSYNYSISAHGFSHLKDFGLSIDKSALYKTWACGNQEIEQNHDWRTFFLNSGYYIQYPKELIVQNIFNRIKSIDFNPIIFDDDYDTTSLTYKKHDRSTEPYDYQNAKTLYNHKLEITDPVDYVNNSIIGPSIYNSTSIPETILNNIKAEKERPIYHKQYLPGQTESRFNPIGILRRAIVQQRYAFENSHKLYLYSK